MASLARQLRLFEGVERDFTALWTKATNLAQLGALTPLQRTNLHKLRDRLHSQQWWLVSLLRRIVQPLRLGLEDRIPSPVKFPDLPRAGQPGVRLTGVRGLGAVPVAVVVVGVILAVVAVVAVAWSLVEAYQISEQAELEFEQTRAAVYDSQRRFEQCRAGGADFETCNAQVPVYVPPPPSATRGDGIPGWAWAGIGIGAAALLLGGLYIYGAGSAPRIERGIYSLPRRVD